jgi:hypothetical protein
MARQRLSWDEKKVAEIAKKADPYTMNQTRMNPPVEKYKTGDPDAWAETPDPKTPWKTEGRTETGHPSPERAAVMAARKLEGKALQCITIAQRMLPGADDSTIEAQATDLMYLPEQSVLATIQRQVKVAQVLAGKDEEEEEEDKEAAKKEPEEEEEKDAAKKEPEEEEDKEAAKKEPEEEEKIEAAKKKVPEEEEAPPKEAAKKKAPEEEEVSAAKKKEEEEEVEAAKKEKEPEEEEVSAAKKKVPPEEEEEVKASDDLLDLILFDDAAVKTGAKKLSGIVKQASAGDVSLDSLWDSPPDVSKAFK